MPVITPAEIHQLAEVRAPDATVVSCYLDTDGRRFVQPRDYERILDQLLRRARSAGHPNGVGADLDRIESFVKSDFERAENRGLAVFCHGSELWKVVQLPVPVRSTLTVNSTASLGQLEAVLQHSDRVGVLLVDKQTARIVVVRLGEIEFDESTVDELPRDYDRVGVADRGGVEPHNDELQHQHLRHAAALAWEVHQREPLDLLVIGASDTIAGELEAGLHQYLRDRLAGRADLGVDATGSQIRAAALELEARAEHEREAALVDDLRTAVASGGLGVAGLDATFEAIHQHRVNRLLVSEGFSLEGWRCGTCDRLAALGRVCAACGAEMVHVDDVVAEAVEETMAQRCRVEMCEDNADLDVLGRIGALLRY